MPAKTKEKGTSNLAYRLGLILSARIIVPKGDAEDKFTSRRLVRLSVTSKGEGGYVPRCLRPSAAASEYQQTILKIFEIVYGIVIPGILVWLAEWNWQDQSTRQFQQLEYHSIISIKHMIIDL